MVSLAAWAQEKPQPPCATDDVHNERMRTDSNYRKDFELVERQIQAKLAKDDSIRRSSQKPVIKRKKSIKSRIVK